MSKGVNKLLSRVTHSHVATVTSMVRAYDGPFIRSLDLKAMGPEINTEILYKAQIMRARMVEIPAHLDWSDQTERMKQRKVSLRVSNTSKLLVFASFLFRPLVFFVFPGLVLLLVSAWTLGAVAIDVASEFFKVDGERPYQPNHGPGNDPYTIRELTTDEARRTTCIVGSTARHSSHRPRRTRCPC